MKVVATRRGFDGACVREPGETFEWSGKEPAKPTWFKPVAKPKVEPKPEAKKELPKKD